MECKTKVLEEGKRLDVYIADTLDISRSKIQTLIKEGKVLLNNEKTIAKMRVKEGDEIYIDYEEPIDIDVIPTPMDLDIVYEDEDVIVINKPKGLVTHPAPGNYSGTLVNGLKAYTQNLSEVGGKFRPGIVHRLDKDTSGLIVIVKNDKAHASLAEQLADKTCHRKYYAIVRGVVEHDEGLIDAPIGRDKKDRQKMAIISSGKPAQTSFTVKGRYDDATLLDIELQTGRTHQIRVHMCFIKHPVLNDAKYDPKHIIDDSGQYLHAYHLSFLHPKTGERLEFKCPMPGYMHDYIAKKEKRDG